MKPLSDTYKKLGIDFTFPIEINDAEGNQTYYENSDGYWRKREYSANGKETYYQNSRGYWWKNEYDAKGNRTHCETSNGYKEGTPSIQSYERKVIEDIEQRYAKIILYP